MKPEIATKLLKGAGFTDELLKKAEEADFKPEEAIEAVNNSQKEHYEQLLKNELTGQITEEVTKQRDGEILNKLNHNLKKSGVPYDDIKDLPMAEKIIYAEKFFKEKAEKTGDKDKLKEEFKALEAEHLKLKNEVSEKEEEWKGKYEEVKKEAQGTLTKDRVDLRLQKEFNTIPDKQVLGGKQDGHYTASKALAETEYDFGMDENNNPVPFIKGTQKRATIKVDGKEVFMNVQDVFKSKLKALNLWVESNGQGQQQKQTTTTTTTETDKSNPAASRLQQMKEAAGVH